MYYVINQLIQNNPDLVKVWARLTRENKTGFLTGLNSQEYQLCFGDLTNEQVITELDYRAQQFNILQRLFWGQKI